MQMPKLKLKEFETFSKWLCSCTELKSLKLKK